MSNIPFSFGKNWRTFLDNYLTEERIEISKKLFTDFCGDENILRDKTFIDIGGGSGLYSYIAYLLGSSKILSIDIDEHSIKCCNIMREKAGNPKHWEVKQGSILDETFIKELPRFDFVYSFGVMHHTGDMWRAIENAMNLAKGYFYIGIYNKVEGFAFCNDGRLGNSKLWEIEKKIYSSLPDLFQNIIDYIVAGMMCLMFILSFNNPVKKIRDHKNLRGMSFLTDIKDWLGGYPYEYASVDEVFNFFKDHNYSLESLQCHRGFMNNEYLFKKK